MYKNKNVAGISGSAYYHYFNPIVECYDKVCIIQFRPCQNLFWIYKDILIVFLTLP